MNPRLLKLLNVSKPAALLLATLMIAITAPAQENPTAADPPNQPGDSSAQSSSSSAQPSALPNPPGLIRRSPYAGVSNAGPQNSSSVPSLPPAPRPNNGAYGYLYRGSLTCGAGAAYSEPESKPTGGCGFGFTLFPMIVTEFGFIAPALNRRNFTIYWSEDATIPLPMPPTFVCSTRGHPIVLGGYTRMFETGSNALDYGIGFERHIDESHSLQFELRDYWTFATTHQHNTMFRLVWITGVED